MNNAANTMPCILVVDDETSIRESFSLILQDRYKVMTAASGEAALKKIVDSKIDLTFLDIRMPGMDGMETLKMIKKMDDSIEVIMVTAVNDVQKAGEAIQYGANNYIVKPFDVEQILAMTKALIGKKYLKDESRSAQRGAGKALAFPQLQGGSKEITKSLDLAEDLAKNDLPLLFLGETGTEKQCLASLIHLKSARKDFPFSQTDLSSGANESSVYEAIFGAGRGAFTYGLEKGSGIIEKNTGGSALLNNIENAPASVQSALVETLTAKTIRRAGGTELIPVNTRLMFSSSSNLQELAGRPDFNKALFDIISASTVSVPPLRDRRDDIIAVANAFINKYNERYNRSVKELSPDAQEILLGYGWPGNISELKNIIKRAVLASGSDIIKSCDLPFRVLMHSKAISFIDEAKLLSDEELSGRFEKEFIPRVLKRADFDMKSASGMLNISQSVLSSKLEGIEISR